MTTLDFITAVVLFGFVAGGFATGLIQSAGSIVGLLLGTTLAGRWYLHVSGWILQFVGGQEKIAQIVAFAAIVVVVSWVFGLALSIFLRVFKIFTLVPGLKPMDKLGGAIFGFAEGALIIGLTLTVGLHLFGADFQKTLNAAKFAKTVQHVGAVLLPLVPKALKEAQAVVPDVNLNNVQGAVNAAQTYQATFYQLQNANQALQR